MKAKISLRLAALVLGIAVFSATQATAAVNTTSASLVAESRSGLYAVAASSQGNGITGVDISVASGTNVQLVTITADASGSYRAVLTDAEGQILRTRAVEGEAEWDFFSLPSGTYRIAILNDSGEMLMHQTLQKR